MSFENLRSLYPERASSNLDASIERLQNLENGKIKKLELREEEKTELLSFENNLGKELEKIVKIKNISSTITIDYLLTEAGSEDFKKTFGLDISSETPQTIESFLYLHRDAFLKVNSAERTGFSGRAGKFSDDNLLATLTNKMSEDGEISIADVEASRQVSLLLTPEKALEKLTSLRNFKRSLKSEIGEINQTPNGSAPEKAKLKILELYKRKVNQLLAENFSNGVLVQKLSDSIGYNSLTLEEKILSALFNGLSTPEKNYSNYDKFIHGASADYDASGNKPQISQEIIDFARKLDSENMEIELHKKDKLKEKGLDPEKIFEKNITCVEFSAIEESLLLHYGQLSAHPASEYDPDAIGPAPDNKWQFISRPEIKSMSVNNGRKVIKAPQKNQSVETMITVLCGHETEGHFIQHTNREKIPLKLLSSEHLGSDRTALFAEGGAMMVQNILSQEAFGFKSLPGSHYVKAMLKKLEGGSYMECVQVYYDSKKAFADEKRNRGLINESTFKKELSDILETAIKVSKRLFNTGVDKNSLFLFLTKSKDTVYLEQLMLMDKLRRHGMEKYAFIGRVNLRNLADLAEISLIDLSQIRKPDFHSLEIWNGIKDKYKIPVEGNSSSATLDGSTDLL